MYVLLRPKKDVCLYVHGRPRMSITTRLPIYEKIEELRRCPLISYVTSRRKNAEAGMAPDAVPELLDQIRALPARCNKVDLLVVSSGGDPTVAWHVMSLLRERVARVGMLVPQAAFSAATLLALGADEIVMHPCGNLGPVDPQIVVQKGNPANPEGGTLKFSEQDLSSFLQFVKETVGLTEQEHVKTAFEAFCKEVGAIPVGVAARSAHLSLSLGSKLLQLHMTGDADKQKADVIAEKLYKEFFHHGYPVGRKEAKAIGLNVIEPKRALESSMWALWEDIEAELQCREPFDPMAILEESGAAAPLFGPVTLLNLPANLPQELARQAYQQVLSQINLVSVPPVDYDISVALVESRRVASAFRVRGKIMAKRDFDGMVRLNNVRVLSRWEKVDIPRDDGSARVAGVDAKQKSGV